MLFVEAQAPAKVQSVREKCGSGLQEGVGMDDGRHCCGSMRGLAMRDASSAVLCKGPRF